MLEENVSIKIKKISEKYIFFLRNGDYKPDVDLLDKDAK